ncbi:hypothetical protein RhiirA4_475539 [Rhizophagus irregularis]|uniref:HTH CENPB-type domain-containing protein n=1 Tax=Rhizophagus irregularis TaxID=588596 RepID=A0A2I1HAB9_9GLOM|nr:hypothetical protein RhiirA4_475539 [Rhizophagus irregularis]
MQKSLTAAQKKEVCLKKIATPFLKQKDLANEYDVSEGMISDILKAKDHWLAVDNAIQANLIITDNILSTKALEFAYLCKEEKFKGSNGWVDDFKKCHNLKQYNIHGEAATVIPNNQEKEIEESLDPLPLISTHSEAIEYYDKLKKEALKQHFISARQINLDSFINSK